MSLWCSFTAGWNECKSTAGALWSSRCCYMCHYCHWTRHGCLRLQGNLHCSPVHDKVVLTASLVCIRYHSSLSTSINIALIQC